MLTVNGGKKKMKEMRCDVVLRFNVNPVRMM